MAMMDVQSLHRLTTQREAQLKTIIRTRPTETDEIDYLRQLIRDAYVKLLFDDPNFASSKDMEQSLWKTCFYRKIEEFRKRIRKFASNASSADNKAVAIKARNDLHAVCTEFSDFLSESLTFYQDLMGRFELLRTTQQERRRRSPVPPTAPDHDCVRSIHRCLIFLGDLARYRELHSESTRKDWSQAERWYYQAIDVFPTSGNPHNQLAVLATYTEAECVAVYRYCRALLCEFPFPTAKENLALLFEKNKQNMPGPSRPDVEQEEEEERLRQGLIAGTITGQQAGIARATLLKSLLQRFVRLHGMLFAHKQAEKGDEGAGAFPVSEFLSMHQTAMVDLRLLLKMSAFGDGLLLHMVVICIFSVVTSMADTGDDETPSQQESSIQSISLSLAFGVVTEIAQCVRTTRQESEHTTAKPPGSRLLGPVVVFCDWLASKPGLWRLKPAAVPRSFQASFSNEGGPAGVAEKEKEGAIREQFWIALCKVATELQVQLQPYPDLPGPLIWTPRDGRVLKEQHDLRGFEPLHAVYGVELMGKPKSELGRLEIVSDDIASSWRTVRLIRFLKEVGGPTGTVKWQENPTHINCVIFTVKGRENGAATSLESAKRSLPLSNISYLPNHPAANLEGEDGDEVIVFKPSFASPDLGLGRIGDENQLSLDDSSQLPKDVLESMIGGLLDCSDSGPQAGFLGGRLPQANGNNAAPGYHRGPASRPSSSTTHDNGLLPATSSFFTANNSSMVSSSRPSPAPMGGWQQGGSTTPTLPEPWQQHQHQHQQLSRPSSSAARPSNTAGWNGFSGSPAPHPSPAPSSMSSSYGSIPILQNLRASTTATSMTPPPGLDMGLGGPRPSAYGSPYGSPFGGHNNINNNGAAAIPQSGSYHPFGLMSNGLVPSNYGAAIEAGGATTGRHSAPPDSMHNHLTTKNPFIAQGHGFMF